ncbi:glycosyltransferase family 2 protein [Geobacter sp. DSM 9736]|uniref:glycosyltransferase n=1 Tax=Geobacter sp. DSM 9736 TaxID=1277350 RepID=UPI000B509B6F|nr:glycosyltransferase [Geobacter sp. DSM 9736]
MTSDAAKLTLIFLLYNAEEQVDALVDAALRQRHPGYSEQLEWLDVVFMDDCSGDGTLPRLHAALQAAGAPCNYRIIPNERNLGLSSTLNKVFNLIRTPYGLTCHLDVLFGRDDYAARMLLLMEAHPKAGAITGQPAIPAAAKISTAEKLNMICNLMDILPSQSEEALVPVGFAEGRCDIFRVEAVRKAGLWDTTLRSSGEDQILALRMRQNGYEIYQAPHLPYHLSVSGEQNSIWKLLKHTHLFGRTQPYILLSDRTALASSAGRSSGSNRQSRLILRASHLAGTVALLILIAGAFMGVPVWLWCFPLFAVALLKAFLFRRHLNAVPLKGTEVLFFLAFVPLQDVYYTAGLLQGLWSYARGSSGRIIR